MMFGVPEKNAIMDLDMSNVYSKEISLLTSYAASTRDVKSSLTLIASKKLVVEHLITHTYALDESQKAFDHAHSGDNVMKIVINGNH